MRDARAGSGRRSSSSTRAAGLHRGGRLPISTRPADTAVISESRPVAFFCAEYGVHASLPVYSGGLGALAGDLLKEASDRALPMVAVGLMYGKGYFRQRIDAGGWQHEYWVEHRSGAAAGGARHRRVRRARDDRRAARRRRRRDRADLAGRRRPRAAVPARHRLRRQRAARAVDHGAAVRRRCRHAARAVRAARHRWRAGAARARDRSGRAPPERGARGVRAARSWAPATAGSHRRASGSCSRLTRRCRRATTPIPANGCGRRSRAWWPNSASTPRS